MQKKGCLGCSFPVLIIISVAVVVILLLGLLTGAIGNNVLHLPSWLVVAQPKPELPAETVFHIGSFPVTNSIIAAWLTIVVLGLLFGLVTRKPKLIPGRLQGLLEWIISWIMDLCVSVAGEKNGRRFFPIVATIFLYVVTNAWLSLLPFFNAIIAHTSEGDIPLIRGAGTDANLTAALAFVSFLFVTYYGIRIAKSSFIGTFFNFRQLGSGFKELFRGHVKSALNGIILGFVDAFVGFIELITYFIRLVSFTLRLFGNMTAGEILLAIMMFLVPWLVAIPFYGLELFIGIIQAFVFAGLTLVFAAMATTSHSEEHG